MLFEFLALFNYLCVLRLYGKFSIHDFATNAAIFLNICNNFGMTNELMIIYEIQLGKKIWFEN